jgi:transcriptional regulator with XRE-family HTH domain
MLKGQVNYALEVPAYAYPMATMGSRIRDLRQGRRLTQEELGQVVGVSGAAISQWESDTTRGIKPENFLRFCAYFRVDPYWLAFGTDNAAPPPHAPRRRVESDSEA